MSELRADTRQIVLEAVGRLAHNGYPTAEIIRELKMAIIWLEEPGEVSEQELEQAVQRSTDRALREYARRFATDLPKMLAGRRDLDPQVMAAMQGVFAAFGEFPDQAEEYEGTIDNE